MHSLRLALRSLFRTPIVTLVAILSLALGIGANAGIFSLFDEMLLRPLPVPHPERLVNLAAPGPHPGSSSCSMEGGCEEILSYPMYRDLERAQTGMRLAGHRDLDANVVLRDQTINTRGTYVSGSYFPALGLTPAAGRLIAPEDDQAPGQGTVVVLSHDFWTVHLGADRGIVGQQITINGQPLTVIGVAPRGFDGTTLGTRTSLFVPLSMRGVLNPSFHAFEDRRRYWIYAFGRLDPGVTRAAAEARINAVYHPIITDVEAPLQKEMSDATLARFRAKRVLLSDGRLGQSNMHKNARAPLMLLLITTGIVLLIACANIANLLLARGASRSLEMAVRLSLGATRPRLLGQLLTESCVLAVLGGAAGLVVAVWTLRSVAGLLPTDASTGLDFHLSASAVLFTGLLALGTGVLFGLFPALHATRPDLSSTIREGTGKHSGTRSAARFRTWLVTAQIALSMALLISAGLFIRSLRNESRVDLGFRVDSLVTFSLQPRLNGYDDVHARQVFERVHDAIAALPGVTGVTEALVPLLADNNWNNSVWVQGFRRGPDTDANASMNEVGAGFVRTMGMTLLSGREFTLSDQRGAPKVAIVNETFARKFGLGRDAVGKRMGVSERGDTLDIEIVGLLKDAKYSQVKDTIPPQYFTPAVQDSSVGELTFYVRTASAPEQLVRTIPGVVRRLDPSLPVVDLRTMPQQVIENVAVDRTVGTLATAFAVLATLLAAVGLYGVLAYSVALRTREIGVRMALGADAAAVRTMVLRQVGFMTIVGSIVGVAAALALGRSARSLLYEIGAFDPLVAGLAVLLLAAVALGAAYVPALRASRVDPIRALRYE